MGENVARNHGGWVFLMRIVKKERTFLEYCDEVSSLSKARWQQ